MLLSVQKRPARFSNSTQPCLAENLLQNVSNDAAAADAEAGPLSGVGRKEGRGKVREWRRSAATESAAAVAHQQHSSSRVVAAAVALQALS